ncbi:MAG: efflux transporter outer membrane subunit [Thiobacillaceae bacterium]|nr:efflux transporter outer membrane subunit [Thiobacillaceae bacterium]MDW8323259.1 efflux transporter outer membrane subunit [Burkholderiales bacterium]
MRLDLRRRGAALVLGLVMSGCAQWSGVHGPPPARPAPPVPAAWPGHIDPQAARPPADWRALYTDPRLKALIERALDHNRDLAAAYARIEEARALVRRVDAARVPDLDLAASAAYRRQERDVSRQYELALQAPAFELDLWGRIRAADAAARARLLASEEAARTLTLALITEVAETYLTTLELAERVRLTASTLDTREQLRDLIARRRAAGLASELDLLQALGAVEQARTDLAGLRRQLALAENALALLTGYADGPLPPGQGLDGQGLVLEVPAGLPSELLLARPDVRAAEARLAAAEADVAGARAAFFPSITLTAALGLASHALSGLFEATSGKWLLQPAVKLPLIDGGLRAADVDAAEARRRQALAEYERTVQQAFREVADLLTARGRLMEQLAALQTQLRTQAERLRLAELRHRAGLTSYLEVLDAQRERYNAEQGVVQLTRALLSNTVRLYQALGGGLTTDTRSG